ncbi:4Fe-4S binding domain protein [Treponema primitia ZAS-2]|uniref:4Fe-4S binding domain protein n=1 Tax=Treponema primitia (strain ATCC BAA-887 / DSM 12427 / ZAS-2) TaxID=545694 RepID=F5YJ25_TREPZ|nr:EFR1 family ferrodoxin [Treponema primitia]AEF83770.1 4Fe-4S binding domain protein [Treponema primitia ZAS-2]
MKGAILYFSLTGNTRLACEYIKNTVTGIEFELINIRDTKPDLRAFPFIGFATFASEFKVARFVKNYIEDMESCQKPAFVFTTYGRNNGAATKILADMVTAKGFRVVLDHALNTPENYPPVIRREHGHIENPTHSQMLKFNRFITELSGIAKKIADGVEVPERKVKAAIHYVMLSQTFTAQMMQKGMGDKKVDTDLCLCCGKCEKTCPYGLVTIKDLPVFNESECCGCFACYNHCPVQAIYTDNYRQFAHYPKPIPQLVEKLTIKNAPQKENEL